MCVCVQVYVRVYTCIACNVNVFVVCVGQGHPRCPD